MALQTSPPISLNDIKSEFGATGARSLTEFYRGGPFVPDIPENSGVPTSGAISVLDFLGATSYTPVSVGAPPANGSIYHQEPAPPSEIVSASTTASASGGTGSYTYSWSYVSGSTDITVTGSGATRGFSARVGKNSTVSAVWRVTATDGTTSDSENVSVALSYITNI